MQSSDVLLSAVRIFLKLLLGIMSLTGLVAIAIVSIRNGTFWGEFVLAFLGGLVGSGLVFWFQDRCDVCAYRFCRCNLPRHDKHNHPYR